MLRIQQLQRSQLQRVTRLLADGRAVPQGLINQLLPQAYNSSDVDIQPSDSDVESVHDAFEPQTDPSKFFITQTEAAMDASGAAHDADTDCSSVSSSEAEEIPPTKTRSDHRSPIKQPTSTSSQDCDNASTLKPNHPPSVTAMTTLPHRQLDNWFIDDSEVKELISPTHSHPRVEKGWFRRTHTATQRHQTTS